MRLGFVTKSLAHPELKSHDARRWQNSPHLSVSLAYLRDMLLYVRQSGVHMYRMTSDLAPYATHPDMPQFHQQIDECGTELTAVGRFAQISDIRLSIHPAQHVVLNSPDPLLAQRSAADLMIQAEILDKMGLGPEAVVVAHVGGEYGDREESLSRFVTAFQSLGEPARRRLVLENDDTRFCVSDTLRIHAATGIRLVFDRLHHRLNNSTQLPCRDALSACLATWPGNERPKVHFSSPRTELVLEPQPGRSRPIIRRPQWRNHSDYANPFEFIDFLRLAEGLRPFDVMLEVKAKDLALLQLRRDLSEYAPDLARSIEGQPERCGARMSTADDGDPEDG